MHVQKLSRSIQFANKSKDSCKDQCVTNWLETILLFWIFFLQKIACQVAKYSWNNNDLTVKRCGLLFCSKTIWHFSVHWLIVHHQKNMKKKTSTIFFSKNQINMGTKTRPCCKLSSEGNIYIDWLSDQYKCLIGKRYLDQEINWLDAIYRHICNYWWESTFKFTKTIVTV